MMDEARSTPPRWSTRPGSRPTRCGRPPSTSGTSPSKAPSPRASGSSRICPGGAGWRRCRSSSCGPDGNACSSPTRWSAAPSKRSTTSSTGPTPKPGPPRTRWAGACSVTSCPNRPGSTEAGGEVAAEARASEAASAVGRRRGGRSGEPPSGRPGRRRRLRIGPPPCPGPAPPSPVRSPAASPRPAAVLIPPGGSSRAEVEAGPGGGEALAAAVDSRRDPARRGRPAEAAGGPTIRGVVTDDEAVGRRLGAGSGRRPFARLPRHGRPRPARRPHPAGAAPAPPAVARRSIAGAGRPTPKPTEQEGEGEPGDIPTTGLLAAAAGRAGRPRVVAHPQAEAGPAGRAKRSARPPAQPSRRTDRRPPSCPASPTRSPTMPGSPTLCSRRPPPAGVAFAVEIARAVRPARPSRRSRRRAIWPTMPPPPSSNRCDAGSSTPSPPPPATSSRCSSRRSGRPTGSGRASGIERIAGDVLAAAFSRGTWHQVPDGRSRCAGSSRTPAAPAPTATTTSWPAACPRVSRFPPASPTRRLTPAAAACWCRSRSENARRARYFPLP